MTSVADFDLITPREIKRLGSAQAVASRLGSAFDEAKVMVRGLSAVEPLGYSLIQNRLHQIPDCLWSDHSKAPNKLGLNLPAGRKIVMQTARHRGRHARYELADADLVILDRDILIRAALFLYFSFRGKSDFDALLAQAFAFAHNAIVPNQPLPMQYCIVQGILINPTEQQLFLQCLNSLLDFIALHEIGHVSANTNGLTSPFFHVDIQAEPHETEGEQIYQVIFHRAAPNQDRIKLPDPMTRGQVEELFCDAFALTARVLMDASGTFSPAVFDALSERLFLLAQFLSFEDMRTMHGEGPSGQVNLARMLHANRGVPPMEPLRHQPNRHESHPPGIRRLDSLLLHSEWIFRHFGINDHPLAPNGDSTFQQMSVAAWNNGLRMEQDMFIDILRAPGLEGADCHVAAWVELTKTLGFEDKTPSVLQSFAHAALTPYLPPYAKTMDEQDNNVSPDGFGSTFDAAKERLPTESKLAGIVHQLCLTLLDPQRWLDSRKA
jgi:hypothetical protein